MIAFAASGRETAKFDDYHIAPEVNYPAYKAGHPEKVRRGIASPSLPPLRIHPRPQDGVFCGIFIKQNLAAMGLKRPTDIQFKSIRPILNGEDVLDIAQTGTGKTAAFAIRIVHTLHKQKKSRRSKGIQCVVMEPTRELALQITEVFDSIGKHTKVTTLCVFGGVEQYPQIARLARGGFLLDFSGKPWYRDTCPEHEEV